MAKINGLLRVKPENQPNQGDTISLSAQTKRGKSGKTYTAFKRDTAEYGGVDCTVLTVKPLGEPDNHGNVTLALDVEGEIEVKPEGASQNGTFRGGGSVRASVDDTARQSSIEAQCAVKAAAEILGNRTDVPPEKVGDALVKISTKAFVAIQNLKESVEPEKPQEPADPPQQPAQGGNDSSEGSTKTPTDDDIPF